jgi:hypothetical protein
LQSMRTANKVCIPLEVISTHPNQSSKSLKASKYEAGKHL